MKQCTQVQNIEKKKWEFVMYLKALACILITNSHCRNIYPVYFLALGGGHGNAIFFILSGFCLAAISKPFGAWMKRRVFRLIPSLIALIFISIVIYSHDNYGIVNFITLIINRYWFVFAILLFYPFYYLVIHNFSNKKAIYILSGYIIIYMYIYCFVLDKTRFVIEKEGFSPIKVFFYFSLFLIGGIIQKNVALIKEIKNSIQIRNILLITILFSIFIWGCVYGIIMIFHKGLVFQILIHISIFIFGVSVLLLAIVVEYLFKFCISFPKFLDKIIKSIADSTLEIYLVQVTFIELIEKYKFPLNFFMFFLVAFIGGIGLKKFLVKLDSLRTVK